MTYRSVIVLDNCDAAAYQTPVIRFLRKEFGKDAAKSAFGFGFRQYEAVLCTEVSTIVLQYILNSRYFGKVSVAPISKYPFAEMANEEVRS